MMVHLIFFLFFYSFESSYINCSHTTIKLSKDEYNNIQSQKQNMQKNAGSIIYFHSIPFFAVSYLEGLLSLTSNNRFCLSRDWNRSNWQHVQVMHHNLKSLFVFSLEYQKHGVSVFVYMSQDMFRGLDKKLELSGYNTFCIFYSH